MPNPADNDHSEALPSGAGELLSTEILEPDPIIIPFFPMGPEDLMDLQQIGKPLTLSQAHLNLKVEFKNYVFYQRIKFYGWVSTDDGSDYIPKGLILEMYTGQGWFTKKKENSMDITYVEEKYATFIQGSDIRASLTAIAHGDGPNTVLQYP